jgi:hypothetical protein
VLNSERDKQEVKRLALTENDYVRALDTLTAPPGSPTSQALGPDTRRAVEEARPWITGNNVVGTGVSLKVTRGRRSRNMWALTVDLESKSAPSKILKLEQVPPELSIPGYTDKVVIDVVQIEKPALQTNVQRVRPLEPGFSVGLSNSEAGTLGCFVAKTADPTTPLVLSNTHVLAGAGLAKVGSSVLQPAAGDGGQAHDEIGRLSQALPFDFTAGFNNFCDAAVADTSPPATVRAAIPGIGTPTFDPNLQLTRVG